MKLITLTVLAAISAASGSSLRGDFETDVVAVDTSNRNLQDCVASSSFLGCFKDRNNNRAMTHEVDGRYHSAEVCESTCADMGYMYFAREWKGQCFCSNSSDYDKHGGADDCDCCGDDVGSRKMCVWMTGDAAPGCDGNGAPSAPYHGCFRDRNKDRALPYLVRGRNHSARDCQDECSEMGMKYFAREWKGQCFCSNDDDYEKHGAADDCDCCGDNVGSNKMCVWHADV